MKARIAKKILKNLRVLHVEEGDAIVLQVPWTSLTPEHEQRIRSHLRALFPGHSVLVLGDSCTLSVVRPDSTRGEAQVK